MDIKTNRNVIKYLAFIFLITVGCQNPKELPEDLSVDWSSITNDQYVVKFIHIDPYGVPTEKSLNLELREFIDTDSAWTLTQHQTKELQKFINDSTNFTGGECGTFFLNGGFSIQRNDTLVGLIRIGCGFGTWFFSPDNEFSNIGSISDTGFYRMSDLLDDIYMQKDSIKDESNEVENIEEEEDDYGETECVYVEDINQDSIYPFSEADRIEIISFDPFPKNDPNIDENFSKINNDHFNLKFRDKTKELNPKERLELFDILFKHKTKRRGNVGESQACYIPHQVIVFYANNTAIDYIEICLECQGYKSHKRTRVDFCSEKWCLLFNFFDKLGLKKGSTNHGHLIERKCKN